jgi:hypothetical protein
LREGSRDHLLVVVLGRRLEMDIREEPFKEEYASGGGD